MQYLTDSAAIAAKISELASYPILWLDTEIADWQTTSPRLSLIQVLTRAGDRTGASVWILDVLDRPHLIQQFIQNIMMNTAIEKVFHNAAFDLRYLGKTVAQNVTCTLKLAKKIGGKQTLGTTDLKLKTLAAELAQFADVDAEPQSSDWGVRSLSTAQLHYAAMDVVYLAAVHAQLLHYLPNCEILLPLNQPMSTANSPASNPIKFSPTKVRVACECPRLFYLNHHFDGKTVFIPPDSVPGVGKLFHDLADKLIDMLKSDRTLASELQGDNLEPTTIAQHIQQRFYATHFFPYLQTQTQKDQSLAAPLERAWQGLRSLIQQFATLIVANRQFCSATTVIQNTFVDLPHWISHDFILPDHTIQPVTGKLDCIVFDYRRQRLCVIEFKTYAPVDPSAQLAQAALYSYLLHQQQQDPIDVVIYCVLPNFQAFHYRWEDLESSIHQVIPHKLHQMRQWLTWQAPQDNPPPATIQRDHLCPMCPEQVQCRSLFEPESNSQTGSGSVSSSQPISEPSIDLTQIGEDLVETLRSFKLETTFQGAVLGAAFIRIKIKPEAGVKVASLLNLAPDLQVQLGLEAPPLVATQAGFVSVDIPRPDRQTVHFADYIRASNQPAADCKIAIGVDLDGQLVEADLADPNTCHFLVGGTTGSGKSEFLRSLLLSLLVRHSPETLKIALVDPKRVTFPEFETIPWLMRPIVKQTDKAIDLMDHLVSDMESRYQRLEKAACNDLRAYNQKVESSQRLPRIVCIFDEYADFMAEKETAKALEQSIKRLGAKARAAGIHLIIATQRPEARVVTPLIRSNLPGRIALRTASAADSKIILGDDETIASTLLGKGDLLYKSGASSQRLQSLFVQDVSSQINL